MLRRKVLIVDDTEINRQILQKILREEYDVLEAANGRIALDILEKQKESISAVLLDLMMPVMDGYEVLTAMHQDDALSQIPVLVTTGSFGEEAEIRVLALGANDFILKPYNPTVIKHRLRNTIKLRETASTVNALRRDKLTRLYNRETFFEIAAERIAAKPAGTYVLSCIDIDNFKVINDQYGSAKGDFVLKFLADAFLTGFNAIDGVCCRVAADNFAMLYPTEFMHSPAFDEIRERAAQLDGSMPPISFSIGRYVIDDLSLSVSAMYDRAVIAKVSVKGRFDKHIALFDESMRESILREQEIINEMKQALAAGQFEAWLQPQYSLSTDALIGAEALVRWRHPKKGLVPPGSFIPVFERNGFVYELDKCVWEQTCALLQKWIATGAALHPVSVNVSRYDVLRADLVETLTGLVERYGVPPSLLHLEITESAFAQSGAQIIAIVKRLMAYGFFIAIDDFGSGYSSLNTLKDVPASLLKLDMRFLEGGENALRGGSILESIVRMAKWLGTPVIAEGVETSEQAAFLKSIGCDSVQGYLYGRPMPVAEYEALLASDAAAHKFFPKEKDHAIDNAFWDPKSMETLIFNSYVGGACIFEYQNGRIDLLRVNEKYIREILGVDKPVGEAFSLNVTDYMDEKNRARMQGNILRAMETDMESATETELHDLPGRPGRTFLRTVVRVIAKAGERQLLYGSLTDVTKQREAMLRAESVAEQMQAILRSISGGISAVTTVDGRIEYVFINERYYSIFGFTAEQFKDELSHGITDLIHPDDLPLVSEVAREAQHTGSSFTVEYRAHRRDGSALWVRSSGSFCRLIGFDAPIQIMVSYDITREKDAEQRASAQGAPKQTANVSARENMLSASFAAMMETSQDLVFVKDCDLRYVSCSRAHARTGGLDSEKDLIGKTEYDIVDKTLADQYTAIDREIMQTGRAMLNYVARLPGDGEARYTSTSKYPLFDCSGKVIGIYGIGHDVTKAHEAFAQLKLLTDSMPCGLASYEVTAAGIRMLYFNDNFVNLTGYTTEEYRTLAEENPLCLMPEEDAALLQAGIAELWRGGAHIDMVHRVCTKTGESRFLNLRVVVSERNKDSLIVNAAWFDVTQQKRMEEDLRIHEEEYKLAIQHSGKLIYRYRHKDRSISMPEETAQLFGLPLYVKDVPESILKTGVIAPESEAVFNRFYSAIESGDKTGEMTIRRRIGKEGWRTFNARFSNVFSSEGTPVSAIIMFEDITEKERVALDLQRMAERDGMTGLYNKTTTESLIRQRLARGNTSCTLLVIDLDRLKTINDTLGHDAGDFAIRFLAATLRGQFRQTDIVGRIGGDEFVAFLDNASNEAALRSQLASFMRKLASAPLGGKNDLPLHASIGISVGTEKSDTFEELFKKADMALYHVKRNGKNDYAFYTPDMEKAMYQYRGHGGAAFWQTTDFDAKAPDHLLHAVFTIYPLVISVNLSANSYFMMRYSDYTTTRCMDAGVYDTLIEDGKETFHPDDRTAFCDAFSRQNLLAAFERGETVVSHEGRQKGDDGQYRWMRTDVVLMKNDEHGDILQITLAREVG